MEERKMTKNLNARQVIDIDHLTQVGFSAYVDHILTTPQGFQGGFRAATAAIVAHLDEEAHLAVPPLPPVHGTTRGYTLGCRCNFCRGANRIADKAYRTNRGNNRITSVTTLR